MIPTMKIAEELGLNQEIYQPSAKAFNNSPNTTKYSRLSIK